MRKFTIEVSRAEGPEPPFDPLNIVGSSQTIARSCTDSDGYKLKLVVHYDNEEACRAAVQGMLRDVLDVIHPSMD